MHSRRDFTKLAVGSVLAGGALLGSLCSVLQRAWAASRKVLPKGTTRESLIDQSPAELDTSNLEITPLEQFGTMGPTNRVVDPGTWRLEVVGHVRRPLSLTYAQLTALPSIERKVLLICPGFFVNHGRWKGVSIRALLNQAGFDPAVTQISIEAKGEKSVRFSVTDVLSEKVFLAYQVNGLPLPRKHGFPLRAVVEDHFGSEWVKYVDKIVVERA